MTAPTDLNAYLVLHRGSRWTDVYRLSPEEEIVLGRASRNQVVLKSKRASRHHARIFCSGESDRDWWVEDLASRNGVHLNGQRLDSPESLNEGDRIEIAGFELRFTKDLSRGELAKPLDSSGLSPEEVTDGDVSLDFDGPNPLDSECLDIVSRSSGDLIPLSGDLAKSRAIPPSGNAAPLSARSSTSADSSNYTVTVASADRTLLQMAFAMGRAENSEDAAELLLQTLCVRIPHAEIGIYFDLTEEQLPPPRRVFQRPGRRYRRPPESLLGPLFSPNASSILARNVVGDSAFATKNSQGEIDVESIILTPQVDTTATPLRTTGLVHVTTAADDPQLTDEDLGLVVTASEIFSEAIVSLRTKETLRNDLQQTRQHVKRLQTQLTADSEILGQSASIQEVRSQIARVANSNAAVLLRGESGVGKELVASAIHHSSSRAEKPLVCLNCAALSKDLLESELFGHEQGAFTGATTQKRGKFETASGGTLMLDEIGEMNLELQAKLLRVLEGHPFERVGGHESVKVDVRVVAATHRDLQAMVRDGAFRQDLFYRLHVIEIVVPPLRQRDNDIVLLAQHFVKSLSRSMGRRDLSLTAAAAKKLKAYAWPGNVRELRNVIERAVVMKPHQEGIANAIDVDDLLLAPTQFGDSSSADKAVPAKPDAKAAGTLAELERQHIERVLQQTGGNKSKASLVLGIERSTLDRKLKRYAKEESLG